MICSIKVLRSKCSWIKYSFTISDGNLSLEDKCETLRKRVLKEILDTEFKNECYRLDDLNLTEILPIIKNCDISVCNDSSFSHLSSGLGIKTIVLMADTPLLYGSYSPKMYPIIPDGETTVTHNTLGKEKINPNKILEQLNKILT